MAKKKVVDAEAAVEEIKNKKFGLSIQNIIKIRNDKVRNQ